MNPRSLLHLVGVMALLPYLMLVLAFVLLERAIASGGLLPFLGMLLDLFLLMVPWGLLALVLAIAALVGLGFGARTLRLAALVAGLIGTAALLVVLLYPTSTADAGQWLFLLPCVLAIGLEFWICAAERGAKPGAAPTVQSVPP